MHWEEAGKLVTPSCPGFEAEVVIPMKPQKSTSEGRRTTA